MKATKLLVTIFAFSMLMTSCSTDEELNEPEVSAALLKSFTITKNVNGEYSVGYTTENATSQLIKNEKANTSEIFLYASNALLSKSFSEALTLNSDKLKVGFVDTNTDKKPTITIIDNNIVFAKGSKDDSMLNDYNITGNEDGTYTLAFSVKNQVEADFVYNEEIDTYEIHLVKGKGNVSDFSREFEANTNALRIDFVNHKNTAAKGYAYRAAEAEAERKPRIVVDSGNYSEENDDIIP